MARPEKWKEEYLRIIERACTLGATDADLADMLGVSIRTIAYWKAEKPELGEVMALGKKQADDRVERSLYARANGYEHEEVDIRVVNNEIIQTPIRKHYPPDTTAAIFWLKNRKPDEWRDKRETEISGGLNVTSMTDEELDRAIAAKEAAKQG